MLSWPCSLFADSFSPTAQFLLPSSFSPLNPFFTLLVTASFSKLPSSWVSVTSPDFPPTSNLGLLNSSNLYLKINVPEDSYLAFLSSRFSTHHTPGVAPIHFHGLTQPSKITSKLGSLAQSSQLNPNTQLLLGHLPVDVFHRHFSYPERHFLPLHELGLSPV